MRFAASVYKDIRSNLAKAKERVYFLGIKAAGSVVPYDEARVDYYESSDGYKNISSYTPERLYVVMSNIDEISAKVLMKFLKRLGCCHSKEKLTEDWLEEIKI